MSDLVGNLEDRFSHNEAHITKQGVQLMMVLLVIFFVFLILFCFVVAMSDLVHEVEAILHLPELLKSFLKMRKYFHIV